MGGKTINLLDVGTNKDLDSIYTYHEAEGPEQISKYQAIRGAAKAMAEMILELCPETRERSIALTKQEEVVMWANSAIARWDREEDICV